MGHEMLGVFQALEAEPGAYRCVILTGAGERVFCAGGDLKERDGMTDEVFAAWFARLGLAGTRRQYHSMLVCMATRLAERMPLNSAASASETPARCSAIRSHRNARIGAKPVPGSSTQRWRRP